MVVNVAGALAVATIKEEMMQRSEMCGELFSEFTQRCMRWYWSQVETCEGTVSDDDGRSFPTEGQVDSPHRGFVSENVDNVAAILQDEEIAVKDSEWQVVIKNTFINMKMVESRVGSTRRTASCMPRLASSPSAVVAWPVEKIVKSTRLPSVGSELHGTLGTDGLQACQPCAWFFKDAGCKNGAACLFCHACPKGEMKHRKRQKIARIRTEEAAARVGEGRTI
eukprot:TRINITY_DN50750_c0_g1_i1.p1 TRINITY_DN50750_c0_g1~~TRINITY_DN50750_c0_g1_i1.p1  ORF type:complete len:223 (-),score=50.35 TRINITY_DN50750_c0_g1_i1:489-1157(-)